MILIGIWHIRYVLLYFAQASLKLEKPALKIHRFWWKTDICSWKHSEKVSLMLDNPFQFHFFVNWSIPAYISSRIRGESLGNGWFSSEKAMFFQVILGVLGRLVNFNIRSRFLLRRPMSLDYLSVSDHYDFINFELTPVFFHLMFLMDVLQLKE